MDFALAEHERMAQDVARRFAREQVKPLVSDMERDGKLPSGIIHDMGALGFFGIPYSGEHAGSGGTYSTLGLVVEELARVSLGVAATVSVHHLATEAIFRFGDADQKKRHLEPLASGNMIGCFAFTEAATGSNPKEIAATASRTTDGWKINGEKTFVSLATVAGKAVVFCKDESRRVSAFVVRTDVAGFHVGPALETVGARSLGTAPVVLEDIAAASHDRLGSGSDGYDILLDSIALGKLCVAHQGVGLAQGSLDAAITYANDRHAYGNPISALPTVQWKLAEMASRLEAARWLAYRSMSLRDRGEPIQQAAATAKLFCARAAVEVADMAMEICGAYGYVRGSAVERLSREARLTELYEGVPDIQRAIIARGVLGSR